MSEEKTGVVFVATGPEVYASLAARAASSVKEHHPSLSVDLFTDRDRDLPVFDRVHVLQDAWHRSKIDAILRSRFERTLYLDSDIVLVAPIDDVFDVLDRFDIALTLDQRTNGPLGTAFWKKQLPGAFPQFNAGVIAVKRSARTDELMREWKDAVLDHGTGRDQPSLREVLWESDVRVATLPPQYNLLYPEQIGFWTFDYAAPRLLHVPEFHKQFRRYAGLRNAVEERLGLRVYTRLQWLLAADRGLAERRGTVATEPTAKDRLAYARQVLLRMPDLARRRGRHLARRVSKMLR